MNLKIILVFFYLLLISYYSYAIQRCEDFFKAISFLEVLSKFAGSFENSLISIKIFWSELDNWNINSLIISWEDFTELIEDLVFWYALMYSLFFINSHFSELTF